MDCRCSLSRGSHSLFSRAPSSAARATSTSSSASRRSSDSTAISSRWRARRSLNESDLETVLDAVTAISPRSARDLRGDGRPRHRVLAPDAAALPRQRLPPARRHLVRVPRHPERDPELHDARPARPASRGSPRSTAGSSSSPAPTGSGKTTTLAVDARPHQPHAPPAHRHDRGPDRDPAPRPRLHRQPARGRPRHRRASSRRCVACCARTRT